MKCWRGEDGLVHILDEILSEVWTYCAASALYPAQQTGSPPTCIRCIGQNEKTQIARAKVASLVDYVRDRTR